MIYNIALLLFLCHRLIVASRVLMSHCSIHVPVSQADRGFKGADVSAGPRSAPVELKRHEQCGSGRGRASDTQAQEADPCVIGGWWRLVIGSWWLAVGAEGGLNLSARGA